MPKTMQPGWKRVKEAGRRLNRDTDAIASSNVGTPAQRDAKAAARRRSAFGDWHRQQKTEN